MRYHTQTSPNPEFATNPNAPRYIVEQVPFTPEEEAARDAEETAVAAALPIQQVKAEILRLEKQITNRRLREAVLTQAGADWLAAQEALIAIERAKL